jgi:hypothetical protein
VGVEPLRVAADGPQEMRGCFFQLAGAAQQVGQVVVRVCVGRLNLHCLLETHGGFGMAPLAKPHIAQVVVGGGELRVERKSLGNQRSRLIEPSGLQGHDTQQVLGVDVLR